MRKWAAQRFFIKRLIAEARRGGATRARRQSFRAKLLRWRGMCVRRKVGTQDAREVDWDPALGSYATSDGVPSVALGEIRGGR